MFKAAAVALLGLAQADYQKSADETQISYDENKQ